MVTDAKKSKHLRIARIVVQPELVWDDGEELSAGPPIDSLSITLTQLREFAEALPGQVADMERQLLEAKVTDPPMMDQPKGSVNGR